MAFSKKVSTTDNKIISIPDKFIYQSCSCISGNHLMGFCPIDSGFKAVLSISHKNCITPLLEKTSKSDRRHVKSLDPFPDVLPPKISNVKPKPEIVKNDSQPSTSSSGIDKLAEALRQLVVNIDNDK